MVMLLRPAWFGGAFVLMFFLTVCWVFDGLPFSAPHALPPIGGTQAPSVAAGEEPTVPVPAAELASASR